MGAVRERLPEPLSKGLSWRWQIERRRREPNDPFFEDGDLVCCLARKQLPLEETGDLFSYSVPEFVCSIARCSKTFNTVSSYEAHYNSSHRNVCGSCGRSLPSNHLLELHVLETHDSLFEILASKQNMFQCLVEGCPLKFGTPTERKDHLVKLHHYPANFRFHKRKTLRSKKSSKAKDLENEDVERMETESVPSSESRGDQLGMNIDDSSQHEKTTSQQKRVFSYHVPKSITFGQGVSRGFYRRGRGKHHPSTGKKGKHWHQQADNAMSVDTSIDIESVKMDDLASALTT